MPASTAKAISMNSSPVPDPAAAPLRGECLSSLVDGEGPVGGLEDACRCWNSDPDLQRDWQLYHLIGDVLRSDELSPAPGAGAASLARLRTRLAAEPVPLAPARLAPPEVPRTVRRWSMPLAIAAGLAGVVVVGTAVVGVRQEPQGAGWGEQVLAASGTGNRSMGVAGLPVAAVPQAPAPAVLSVPGQMMVRDPRLDAYIEAHRGALAPLPVAMPGAALRSVDMRAVAR